MALRLENSNPYAGGYIANFGNSDRLLLRNDITYPGSSLDELYTVKQGDRIDLIAGRKYKNSRWYFAILLVNKIFDPFELTVGQTILIPDLEVIKTLIR